jgi:glyoxalase family protein
MRHTIPGIHHITAIASDPQRNVEFYTGVLGLRLVKRTVNFDDPGTYHLYYGDSRGTPGSILTFFPWPGAPRGRQGTGQVVVTSFSTPGGGIEYWARRLAEYGISAERSERFDETVLALEDPDGLRLEIVEHSHSSPGVGEPLLDGFYGATLAVEGYERTALLLGETFGFQLVGEDTGRFRYQANGRGPASRLDVLCSPGMRNGAIGAGTVHHVAWRTPDDAEQQVWRLELHQAGYNVTPVMDRNYFRSIYFREPGGVLFEIATDPPGFTVDEPVDELGNSLQLPPWLEKRRQALERVLPPLEVPQDATPRR